MVINFLTCLSLDLNFTLLSSLGVFPQCNIQRLHRFYLVYALILSSNVDLIFPAILFVFLILLLYGGPFKYFSVSSVITNWIYMAIPYYMFSLGFPFASVAIWFGSTYWWTMSAFIRLIERFGLFVISCEKTNEVILLN